VKIRTRTTYKLCCLILDQFLATQVICCFLEVPSLELGTAVQAPKLELGPSQSKMFICLKNQPYGDADVQSALNAFQ
jgi:hypothetical protein